MVDKSVYQFNKRNGKDSFNVDHKFSKDEYKEKRDAIINLISQVQNILNDVIPLALKKRMLIIDFDLLKSGIEYYFTRTAQKGSSYVSKNFMKAGRHIFESIQNLDSWASEDQKKEILEKLREIIAEFKNQEKYVEEVEEQVHKLKSPKSAEKLQ